MKKIPCSVPILTLNAEKNLAECLATLTEFEDVYLVDGNSTDRTREIAKQFNIPVYKQVETDEPNVRITDFVATRRRAYNFAKTDWLLDLDADECLTPELVKEMRETIGRAPEDTKTAYLIPSKYRFGERVAEYAFFYPSYVLRLYNRKSGIDFPDGKVIHESVVVPNGVIEKKLTNFIWSRGPETYAEAVRKDNKYLAITRQRLFLFEKGVRWGFVGLCLWSVFENIFRAAHVLLESLWIYCHHGYRRSLPWGQMLRHVRYNLLIAWMRLCQTFAVIRRLLLGASS